MKSEGITNISIEQLYPHPANPRKDLGDLTELAESIKKNGIMQNLTVIPGHTLADGKWNSTEGYTLIIGHRRHAAAKLAGIKELPCRIVEGMSEKEQMSTMLEENMQRNDLSIWEQSQGFQMMLDLGETEETIAEKTGFSRTTVRHRLNIAKLDQEELRKKEMDEGFQMTLNDLYALEKVEDIEIRNKILKEATDSRQLIWKAKNAVDDAERQKKLKSLKELLIKAGISEAPKSAENEIYSAKWEIIKEYDLNKDVPKRLSFPKEDTKALYYLYQYQRVKVIKKSEKKPETEADIVRKQKDKDKKQIRALMNVLNDRKKRFIECIITGKIEQVKEVQQVQEEIWHFFVQNCAYISQSNMRRFFTDKSDYDCTQEEKTEADSKVNQLNVLFQMLISLNYAMDNIGDIYDYSGSINSDRAEKLKKAYDILTRYGWTFEDEEQKLLDGTHELYAKE